jgi:hypothetical protein
MFWAFKMSFGVDILAFFDLATFWAVFLKNLATFFSNLLVTLVGAKPKSIIKMYQNL